MDADLYYLVGRGRSVKKHPDVVVTQSNAQAGMSVGAIFNKRSENLAYLLLVERQAFRFTQFDQLLSALFLCCAVTGGWQFLCRRSLAQ